MTGACETCRSRKLKCSKTQPCSSCSRSNAECAFKTRTPVARGRAGGRKSRVRLLQDQIKLLESTISDLRGQVEFATREDGEATTTEAPVERRIVSEDRSHARDSSNFWSILDLQAPVRDDFASGEKDNGSRCSGSATIAVGDAVFDSTYLLFPLQNPDRPIEQKLVHPSPFVATVLVETYLTNVDPIFKIVHAPSLRRLLSKAGLDHVSGYQALGTPESAMLFVVYSAAVMSMDDIDCQNTFGEARKSMLHRHLHNTQRLFAEADLLNSQSLILLQAFVIYLLVLRSIDNRQHQWALIALAVRLARSMNFHQTSKIQNLSAFDREMSSRVWHQLRVLEFRAALDRGEESDIDQDSYSTPHSLNIHDTDIDGNSDDLPKERQDITACTFSVLCQACVTMCRQLNRPATGVVARSPQDEWEWKKGLISEFENRLWTEVFPHCDISQPLHWYIQTVFQGLTPMFRLMFYRPIWHSSKKRPQPRNKNEILHLALTALKAEDNSIYQPQAKAYAWHQWVQWYTLAVALAELCGRPDAMKASSVWSVIEKSYLHQRECIADSKNGRLWRPVENLMNRARLIREDVCGEGNRKSGIEVSSNDQLESSSQDGYSDHLTNDGHEESISNCEIQLKSAQICSDIASNPGLQDTSHSLQQENIDPTVMDEAWSFWQTFMQELSTY